MGCIIPITYFTHDPVCVVRIMSSHAIYETKLSTVAGKIQKGKNGESPGFVFLDTIFHGFYNE